MRNRTLSVFRALALGALLLVSLRADETRKSYDLPAGDAAATLKQFAEISGRETLFAAEVVRGVKTHPVKGSLTAQEALDAMLTDTGLIASPDVKTGAFSVRRGDPGPNAPRADQTASVRPGQVTKTNDGTVEMGEYEVTGSRIRGLLGEADFSPMVRFERREIEQLGISSMGELSRLIPQAFSQGSYEGVGFGGQQQGTSTTSDGSIASVLSQRTNINLRGLGAANTLVLINGRRMARSGNIRGSEGYDLTGIPVAAIERVEVVTDGSSAIYGSDAVGGVINIILRKNFSGTEATLSYENTFDTDTAVINAAITHGITRGPLSLTLTATYQKRNAFAAVDRPFSATDDWVQLGGTTGFATSVASAWNAGGFITGAGIVRAISGNLPGRTSPFALIPDGANGALRPASDYITVTPTIVGNFQLLPAYTGDRAKYVNLISPQFTRTIGVRGTYDLRPNLQLHYDAGYNETRTHIEGMPVNFRNSIGIASALSGAVTVPADYPGNPFGVPVNLLKTFWELPTDLQGQKFTTNSNLNFAGSLQGRFGADWRYDAGVSWNRSELKNENAVDPVLEAGPYNAAIAARSLVLFYDSRAHSPNDLNLLRSMLRPGNARDATDTVVWSVSTDGSLPWFTLPAGAVRMAFGAEHTTENIKTAQSVPDNPLINLSLLGDFERTLTSAYAETRIPLLGREQGVPLVNRFDATAAIRYDEYSDVGGDNSPRYGLQWRPVSWLLFRGTRNHAFRAPSVQALYRPVTNSTNSNPSGFVDPVRNELVTGTVTTRIGGNINLKPERSTSDNLGVVLDAPGRWLKGLSFSVDLIEITYKDKISSFGSLQEIATLAPDRLIRDATGPQPGRVTGIDTRSVNLAKDELEVVDYAVQYRRSTSWGHFSARAGLTDYRKVQSIRIAGAAPVTSLHLRPTRMSWQAYWNKGPYGAGVSGFYQDKIWTSAARTTLTFASAIEWNTQFAYDFGWKDAELASVIDNRGPWRQRLLSGTKVSLNVNNILDREPPHRQGNAGFGVTDPRMARYTLTLRKQF
jgi:iron complex outermembrane recepter protein